MPLPTPSPSSSCLPPIPRSIQEKVLVQMHALDQPLYLKQVAGLGRLFVEGIYLPPDKIKLLETVTAQSSSKRWHEENFGRITAQDSCILQNHWNHPEALKWGHANEGRARLQYAPPEFHVRECGLYLCGDLGFLGAFPDGLVIRIQMCPYSARHTSVDNMCEKSIKTQAVAKYTYKINYFQGHDWYHTLRCCEFLLQSIWRKYI